MNNFAAGDFSFGPVRASTLKEKVKYELQVAILRCHLRPDTRIVESKLAKEMHVAQSTIREAIHDLVSEGFLIKRVNRDTLVRKLTAADIGKLFRVRKELEGLAIELAHSNVDEKALAPLYETVEQMRKAARLKSFTEFYWYDVAFHQQLGRLACNEFLERALIPLLVGPVAFVLAGFSFPLQGSYVQLAEDHLDILDAFKEKTPKEARHVMESKLQDWNVLQMRHLPEP